MVEASLDTGGGCKLVHQGALISSTNVNLLNNVPKISAAQGQQLFILGVSFDLADGGSKDFRAC
jgi:hypothetical protein